MLGLRYIGMFCPRLKTSVRCVALERPAVTPQVPLPACFLDAEALASPGSQDSGSVRDLEVVSQTSEPGHRPSRTSKQLQSVAKQFGSIGKTVSKKIRKNLGNITRLARTGSFKGPRGAGVSATPTANLGWEYIT